MRAGFEGAGLQVTASSAASLGRAATHAAAEVLDQDEHSADWRTQRKHFFVLSNAGASLPQHRVMVSALRPLNSGGHVRWREHAALLPAFKCSSVHPDIIAYHDR